MLERHFRRPDTVDRIRALWLGPQIDSYVEWLDARRASNDSVLRHVSTLRHFNAFVCSRAVSSHEDLPLHVQPFVDDWMRTHGSNCRNRAARGAALSSARVPVEQFLELTVPGFGRLRVRRARPFMASVPGFFDFLRDEKGLRPATCDGYAVELRKFEAFLERSAADLSELSPTLLSNYVTERAKALVPTSLHECTGALRMFLRYLHRQNMIPADISRVLPRGRKYKQSSLPRALPWADVQRVLESVDRRSNVGKRNYAILMLLASYGLRAREVAALELEDIDWAHSQLRVPVRKGGHSSIYPLSASVGEAIVDYLRCGRPQVDDRHVFLTCRTPFSPMNHYGASALAAGYIIAAGIKVPRPGSHTLRHSCVQRLVESDVAFKAIGDYVGHRRAESTLVYAKVALHRLRQLAIGDAEEAL
ncbi:MAG: tyrosine-type recombinase/integrase [Pseudomonadota bacterium]